MSRLRPECTTAPGKQAMSKWLVLCGIRDAIARRRSLAYGKLDDDETGRHCAMGAFWDENPSAVVGNELIDQVSAINDSVPPEATDFERWQHVWRWVRSQVGY